MAEIQAVSLNRHRDKRWKKVSDFKFAANNPTCPIVLHELNRLVSDLAIGIYKIGSSYSLVAILGVKPQTNLHVRADGSWRGQYLPMCFRTYPFLLLNNNDGERVLCLDESTQLVDRSEPGEDFFDAEGELSEILQKVVKSADQFQRQKLLTDEVVNCLIKNDLIEPWTYRLNDDSEEQTIANLFRISESRLNELSVEALVELHGNKGLYLAYCQLLSMVHFDKLIQMSRSKDPEQNENNVKDLFEDSGTISFDNI